LIDLTKQIVEEIGAAMNVADGVDPQAGRQHRALARVRLL
jgi:hypothetical protein